ncbi:MULTISPECIES: hypothetical protein [Asticcacaulis]|uniref:hypothetical protein n=1 Tax=Asticcacaulis TaxID=76890 RepID=UPI001AE4F487|nr:MULTISPECIES: hypothetical protein [Asticcacaulis]MBP2158963.1 hypothetical protein [Asticcacaulis solisilvae]MDR6800008.1 hypothetical protein [Asticcacaulis sp. BE141]
MKRAIVSAMMGIAVLAAPVGASAEIIKTAMLDNPKCDGLCLRWWPRLVPPPKWAQDTRLSQAYNVAFLVPKDGRDDVFIYANAQPLKGQAVTVAGFMADDQATFERAHPGLRVRSGADFTTADAQVLPSRIFDPAPQDTNGLWEVVAYGEEVDRDGVKYYLVFILGARSEAVRDEFLPVFQSLVASYRK